MISDYSMDNLIPALADFLETLNPPLDRLVDISRLRQVSLSRDSFSLSGIESMLNLSKTLSKTIMVLTAKPDPDSVSDGCLLDSPVSELVTATFGLPAAQVDFAVDELLLNTEVFASVPDVSRSDLAARLSTVEHAYFSVGSQAVYSPRMESDTSPDEFGEWDEYRSDSDPGYRVREVYESDLSVPFVDDELSCVVDRRDSFDSPTFGFSCGVPSSRLRYDYMGRVSECAFDHSTTPNLVSPFYVDPMASLQGYPRANVDALMLPVVYARGSTGFEPTKEFDCSINTLVAGRYRLVGYLGSAAFSKAMRAEDLETGELVCLKIIKNDKDFFDQSLDEIKILQILQHVSPHVLLDLKNFFYWKEHLIIVTEVLLDNLYEWSTSCRKKGDNYFTLCRIQSIAKQLLQTLEFVHGQNIIHCDIKPENILFSSYSRCEVKLIDFGSACFQTDKPSTYVQSRSYRAPEVVLGCLPYSTKIDMWSLGCVLAELWTGHVLFQNDSTHSLLARILGIIGPKFPPHMMQSGQNVSLFFQHESLCIELDAVSVGGKGKLMQLLLPKRSSLFQRMRCTDLDFLDFLSGLLQIDPDLRMSATQALAHRWLTT